MSRLPKVPSRFSRFGLQPPGVQIEQAEDFVPRLGMTMADLDINADSEEAKERSRKIRSWIDRLLGRA
jgi:hypothetical protein